MEYNVFIKTRNGYSNLFGLTKEKTNIVVSAYLEGKDTFTVSGKKYFLSNLFELKIITNKLTEPLKQTTAFYLNNVHFRKLDGGKPYLPVSTLERFGDEVTDEFIGDNEFGSNNYATLGQAGVIKNVSEEFVNLERIQEFENISNEIFDFTKLVQFCKEINCNYLNKNYLSVTMLVRSIINHIPPVFGYKTFNEVANNYGNASFKKSMMNLNNSMKNIADSILHDTIRKSEVLPNNTQVNFSNDLDVLLAEVVRVAKIKR
jgi:hypothetical protein